MQQWSSRSNVCLIIRRGKVSGQSSMTLLRQYSTCSTCILYHQTYTEIHEGKHMHITTYYEKQNSCAPLNNNAMLYCSHCGGGGGGGGVWEGPGGLSGGN